MIYSLRFASVADILDWFNDNDLNINIVSIVPADSIHYELVVFYEII